MAKGLLAVYNFPAASERKLITTGEDVMELCDAIRTRRSVRKFTDHFVSDDDIRQLLEAARFAQSWANTQAWEFVVVRDRGFIEQVTGTYVDKNPAIRCSLAASVLLVACARTGVSGCYGGVDVTKFPAWFMFDVGIAVQNICLKAHDMGLGTVVVGFLDHDACGKILGLPDGYEVVAVLPVGKPAGAPRQGPPRKEIREFVHLDRYGNPFA
ncbi:MAG TPA: nitroreductase family protein [Deltaproteobacteria bacterium]|jgi:nitroreductase|nr:nitroreductase family protein [Deltaproteobacteria bacterium]HRW81233.1 nitroreductase family protein [Desulfomonilia bacterium]HOC76950.1 nitroreductase family protein [Deltaproteobacteria bacterium]HOG85560.1 nitroreductase family protein [Deltaproteobacteria bacterium]HON95855.1 nitroreductase family protein [Deltaproteobacteria bacterium]